MVIKKVLWIYSTVVTALSVAFGIYLIHTPGVIAVATPVKLFLLPGTLLAFLFPGVHSDFFIVATAMLNIVAYIGAAMMAMWIIARLRSPQRT